MIERLHDYNDCICITESPALLKKKKKPFFVVFLEAVSQLMVGGKKEPADAVIVHTSVFCPGSSRSADESGQNVKS